MNDFPHFDRIVPEGKAMAFWNDKALFCVGPLPGEVAKVRVIREKKSWAEAAVEEILTASPHRHEPREEHYLSCSPWQGVDYAYQLELKKQMLAEIYGRPELSLPVDNFAASPQQYGYRNKLEFSLVNIKGQLQLAFHTRGTSDRYVMAPDGCVLGSDALNAAAIAVLKGLNELDLKKVAQSLILRESSDGQIIAVVVLRDKASCELAPLGELPVDGIVVALKQLPDTFRPLWSHGISELSELIGDVTITYPWDSFFQVNPPAFAAALKDILLNIDPKHFVADLYGGAGTIGLPVAKIAQKVVGIEISPSAVKLANANAEKNELSNYQAFATPSEKMNPEIMRGVDTVIVDPPRNGLNAKVIEFLLEAKPSRIIYLSCNPITQVRDVMLLMSDYQAASLIGYDFYPGTLHLESLVVLDRK